MNTTPPKASRHIKYVIIEIHITIKIIFDKVQSPNSLLFIECKFHIFGSI